MERKGVGVGAWVNELAFHRGNGSRDKLLHDGNFGSTANYSLSPGEKEQKEIPLICCHD